MTSPVPIRLWIKDPLAVLDYGEDWASDPSTGGPWLADGEVIETSTWTVDDTSLHIDRDDIDGSITVVWLSAGSLGKLYLVRNEIVTNGGRTDVRTIAVFLRNR